MWRVSLSVIPVNGFLYVLLKMCFRTDVVQKDGEYVKIIIKKQSANSPPGIYLSFCEAAMVMHSIQDLPATACPPLCPFRGFSPP